VARLIRLTLALGAAAVLAGAWPHQPADAAPQHPFPVHAVYAPGTIRPAHRSQAQLDADVRAYYDQWKSQFLVAAGPGFYRVAFGTSPQQHAKTVSEGQGYGMIIVALMAGHDPDAQNLFDGLWRFARAHPSDIDSDLMGWIVPPDGSGNDSAFDGDCDMAYALLLADSQWGSGGAINYSAEAKRTIAAVLAATIGPDSRLPMLGDWTDPGGRRYNQYTPRSSDFMLDHFRAFGRATGNPAWTQVVAAVQAVIAHLQGAYSPGTGLLPDFIQPVSRTDHTPRPAKAGFLEGRFDGKYSYNATRDPWRIGTDALLNDDATSHAQARTMSTWVQVAARGNPQRIRAGYSLDGRPLSGSKYFTIVFAAPFGVAAMTEPSQQQWLNDVYDAVRGMHEDYYEDSVTLLCLLVMTRSYWDPTTIGN
jgi:endo-1,4-beta-D-glucanase Y